MANRVGGEVDAVCTKCRMTLAHTILAMVGTKIARVRCNTCGGDHAYRAEGGTTRERASSGSRESAAARPTRAEKVIVGFEQRLAGRDLGAARKYNAKESFAVDEVISHPTFGFGIVTALRGDKIDVDFKAYQKTLVQARPAGTAQAARPSFQPPKASATGAADKPHPELEVSPEGGEAAEKSIS